MYRQAVTRPHLYRNTGDAIVGGVAAGLAEHLGLGEARWRWTIRAAFAALCFSGGLGILLYGAYWIVVPTDPAHTAGRRPAWLRYGVGLLATGALLWALAVTVTVGHFAVPVFLAVLGGALIWRQASQGERTRWLSLSRSSLSSSTEKRIGLVRLAAGALMVIAGGVIIIARGTSLSQIRDALIAIVVVAVGFGLITGPMWVRMVTELAAERRARILAREREEMAAHLHDSVLQTLALIQRNAESPREVARLARGQERELRHLLYGDRAAKGALATALHASVAEVEDAYAVKVNEVVVGDAQLDEHLSALAQAAREALVNAAKHAGVASMSLYAEVEDSCVEVYVRDRGGGFDVDSIPEDRRGVRGSIQARMERHGGTATIRSKPGEGTEVQLRMERTR
ncbi:MAG: ATP-binding protein [Jatrophihabitans sp.]